MRRILIGISIMCLLLTGGCVSVTVTESYLSSEESTTQPVTRRQDTTKPGRSTVLPTTTQTAATSTKPFILFHEDLLTGEVWYEDAYTGETFKTYIQTTGTKATVTKPQTAMTAVSFEHSEHPRATMTPDKAVYRPDETVRLSILLHKKEGATGYSQFSVTQAMELWEESAGQWIKKYKMYPEWPPTNWFIRVPDGRDVATGTKELALGDYYDIGYGKRYKVFLRTYDRNDKEWYLLSAEFSIVSS